MELSDAMREDRLPLIKGSEMLCPRCERYRNILHYQRLEQITEYEDETNALYKCPRAQGGCSFIFSPADRVVLASMTGGNDSE